MKFNDKHKVFVVKSFTKWKPKRRMYNILDFSIRSFSCWIACLPDFHLSESQKTQNYLSYQNANLLLTTLNNGSTFCVFLCFLCFQ